jgi:dTDP-4-dehydrorhamnose reductase
MRLLVTGLKGTLAPLLAQAAHAAGHEVIGWDRRRVPPDDVAAGERCLREANPDAIAHLATGGDPWAGRLAAWAAARGRAFVLTSTAMVFHHAPDGPHGLHDERTAQDEYGRGKIACEDAVLAAHPAASVVRLGWQIDPVRPGNNMLMQLDQWQARDGCVAASRAWRPACSFMHDTAAALLDLIEKPVAGPVHLDSNADEGHAFADIVAALRRACGREAWQLRVHGDYRHDQRLAGGATLLPPLSARLPGLVRTAAA